MKFKAEQIDYIKRLKKEFLAGFLILTTIIIYVHFKNSSTVEITAALIGITGLGLSLAAHLTAKTYFYEVEIKDGILTIRGDSMNKPLTIQLPISETSIFPKSKGKGNVEYFIRFKQSNKTYDINRLFNWNYKVLIELFHSFKEAKNEKIIWDEKYLLEFMDRKSKGISSFEIAFGSEKKDDPTT